MISQLTKILPTVISVGIFGLIILILYIFLKIKMKKEYNEYKKSLDLYKEDIQNENYSDIHLP